MPTPRMIAGLGWRPDNPDFRDWKYEVPEGLRAAPSSDLRAGFPERPWDQGELGSCTAHGAAAVVQYALQAQGLPVFMPSRLFIYYNTRAIEGMVMSDAGGQIRDAIKAIAQLGACDETVWPYDEGKFADKPPDEDFTEALQNKALHYESIDQKIDLFRARLTQGYPIDFGFTVYESLESSAVDATGNVSMPLASEGQIGAHCVVLCGHDDDTRRFLFRNSWGEKWGAGGYGTLPYDYVSSDGLAADFWTVDLVS